MSRDYILHRTRTGLGRSVGEAPPAPPEVRIRVPEIGPDRRLDLFCRNIEALAGKAYLLPSPDEARAKVEEIIGGATAVASNASYLRECEITSLPRISTGITDRAELRAACASAGFGITSADYALADTGTLVMIASPEEARLVSLLPPVHIAVVPRGRVLTGLDELFTLVPRPADITSSMVLITGPSRTADIEQILVRGVHGPGEIHVILV